MSDTKDPHGEGFVSSYLLYLLAASSEAASAQFHLQVREAGLRVPEWRVLACLHDTDGQMITRLAEFALAEQSRLSRIIDGMVRRGLLERRDDAQDKRRVRIFLTDQGARLAAGLVQQAKAHEASVLEKLPADQVRVLVPALKTMLRSLRDE